MKVRLFFKKKEILIKLLFFFVELQMLSSNFCNDVVAIFDWFSLIE